MFSKMFKTPILSNNLAVPSLSLPLHCVQDSWSGVTGSINSALQISSLMCRQVIWESVKLSQNVVEVSFWLCSQAYMPISQDWLNRIINIFAGKIVQIFSTYLTVYLEFHFIPLSSFREHMGSKGVRSGMSVEAVQIHIHDKQPWLRCGLECCYSETTLLSANP